MTTANADNQVDVIMASSFKGPPDTQTAAGNLHDKNEERQKHESSSSISALSEDFEHLIPGQNGVNISHCDHNVIEVDRPEISMQIRNVEHALQSLTEGGNASEITAHLSELVPKIIRLERKVKMQMTLRCIFEEENQHLKTHVEEIKQENENLSEETRKLQEEISELQKAKEEEQLGGFDFVTTKEAREIKDAQKKDTDMQQYVTAATAGISEGVHFTLQRKYITLKKQMEEIVKVNHSWDEHYRNMKTQLQAQIEDLQSKLKEVENQTESHKEKNKGYEQRKDDILEQKKTRLELTEKEIAGAVAEVDSVNRKCEKLERYARTLTGQRNAMEKEIRRLNEALAQKLKSGICEQSAKVNFETHTTQSEPIQNSSSGTKQGHEKWTQQKGLDEMTETEMKEELELLRQQNEVFQSDFFNERQDRQRVMGELDAVQKELKRTKIQLQKPDVYVRDEEYMQYHQNRPYSTSAPQPRYYGSTRRPPKRYVIGPNRQEQGGLIAHGRGGYVYNTAGNDVYIDGIATDGSPEGSLEPSQSDPPDNTLICPRCEGSFDNDHGYHIHINECMND